mmetsp:Transcript_23308/g.40106  ORF Transcript_23308/g.40106 Transcript_23308/m.40106 type:complete len:126 (-) Transcript_23308:429-806(-)
MRTELQEMQRGRQIPAQLRIRSRDTTLVSLGTTNRTDHVLSTEEPTAVAARKEAKVSAIGQEGPRQGPGGRCSANVVTMERRTMDTKVSQAALPRTATISKHGPLSSTIGPTSVSPITHAAQLPT